VPREVLVATGASVLAPAAALALLVVAGMFIWQTWVQRDDEHHAASQKAKLEEAERKRAAALAAQDLATVTLNGLAAAAQEAMTRGATGELPQLGEDGKKCKQEADDAAEQARTLQGEIDGLRNTQRDEDRKRRRQMLLVGMGALFLASLGAALGWLGLNGLVGTIVVVVVAALTSAVALLVHARTEKFAWLAATAFVGVGLTFAFAIYFDARGERQVVPAAVLLSNRAPVYGFLVAQRDDRVYLGTIDGSGPTQTHVVELDRKQITDLLLDAHVRRDGALADARALAHRLCGTLVRDPLLDDGSAAKKATAQTASTHKAATTPASNKRPAAIPPLCTPREITALDATPVS
jgi:hypothetical protein